MARTVSVGPGLFGGKARGDGLWKTCPSKASCWFLACHVAMPKCQNIPEIPKKHAVDSVDRDDSGDLSINLTRCLEKKIAHLRVEGLTWKQFEAGNFSASL